MRRIDNWKKNGDKGRENNNRKIWRWDIGFILSMKEGNSRRKRKRNNHAHYRDVIRLCSSKKKNPVQFSKKMESLNWFKVESTLDSDRFGSSKEREKFRTKIKTCGVVGPVWPNATGWPSLVQAKKRDNQIRFKWRKRKICGRLKPLWRSPHSTTIGSVKQRKRKIRLSSSERREKYVENLSRFKMEPTLNKWWDNLGVCYRYRRCVDGKAP